MSRLFTSPGRLATLLAGLLAVAPWGAAPAAEADRNREIAIELAWMGDPVTFRCPLRARCSGGTVEVVGCVPDAAARASAVQAARQNFTGTVKDALTLGRVGGGFTTLSPEVTYSSVRAALTDALGDKSKDLDVSVRGDGQVTLRGKVSAVEEKLAVSTRLRQVAGCSCVVNLIETSAAKDEPVPAYKQTKVITTVQPLGAKPMPLPQAEKKPAGLLNGLVKSSQETTVTEVKPEPKKSAKSLWHVFKKKPAPVEPTPVATVQKKMLKGDEEESEVAPPKPLRSTVVEPKPVVRPAPRAPLSSPYGMKRIAVRSPEEVIANTEPRHGGPPIARAEPLAAPQKLTTLPAEPLLMPKPAARTPVAPETVIMPKKVGPALPTEKFPEAEPLTPRSEFAEEKIIVQPQRTMKPTSSPVMTMPTKVIAAPRSSETIIRVEPTPLTMPTRVTTTPAPAKPRGLLPNLFGRASAQPAPTQITTMPTRVQPAMVPLKPAPASARATVPDKPYVASGTVIFHDPKSTSTNPVTTSTVSAPASSLRQKIMTACGRSIKDVRVVANPDGGMVVTVTVSRSSGIDEVLHKTAGMTEMASPKVETRFEVDP